MTERLVVVGGDAGGMPCATNARRLRPSLDVVALELGPYTSYSACGIPYVVSGDIASVDSLIQRSPDEHRRRSGIDVRTGHEAIDLDLAAGAVTVHDHVHDRTYRLTYDIVHLATGATPARPPLPGIDLPHVHGVQTLADAADLLNHAEAIETAEGTCRVVVAGGGYIGVELAEAFAKRGAHTTIVTDQDELLMPGFDPEVAARATEAVRGYGIDVVTGVLVTGFADGTVETAEGTLPANLVVLGLGSRPNSDLAARAGLETGVAGSVVVDRRQQTSVEEVYAAGDCTQTFHRVTQKPLHVPLGTHANKQARVAGINIGGGYATFPGIVGTAITRVCEVELARTGVTATEALEAGFEVDAVTLRSKTTAGYFPGGNELSITLVAERGSSRLLGAQIVGGGGAAKRIDTAAVAITAGLDLDDVIGLDLAYAPPFGGVWDSMQAAARKLADPRSADD